ncbi:MAG TPA: Fe-S cluster assembly ATPase SufC [Candidatus Peribacteria bacterium]|nr:Fe-S cluster assembly ATPase SufC [Candidatus Peribacteria bacterium]
MPTKRTAKNTGLLSLDDFRVSIDGKEIVRGLDLEIRPGEVHAIMGPNGSGKSTLVNALMGHPKYEASGKATLLGETLAELSADQRACKGLFLAFQYPKEIAGVTLRNFLLAAYESQMRARDPKHKRMSPIKFRDLLQGVMRELHMDPAFAERSLNQGFSGGEKKKAEILQLNVLKPKLALLDETDSGLDVDALRIVSDGVNRLRSKDFSALIVTHYARILDYIVPDRVHVMVQGRLVESGGPDFARKLEREGYARYGVAETGRIKLDL